MLVWGWILAGVVAVLAVAGGLAWKPVRAALLSAEYERARKAFHRYRERLESNFFQLAAASGKPRGLRWTHCDFDNDVAYVRDRRTAELSALVAVTIGFEAVEGGMMEGVEAVGNLRAATAVFRFERGRWHTDGRAIFNLNPTEAIAYYRENLEIVGQELARPR